MSSRLYHFPIQPKVARALKRRTGRIYRELVWAALASTRDLEEAANRLGISRKECFDYVELNLEIFQKRYRAEANNLWKVIEGMGDSEAVGAMTLTVSRMRRHWLYL